MRRMVSTDYFPSDELDRLGDYTRDELTQIRSLDYMRWLSASAHTGNAGPATAAAHYLERWPRTYSTDLVKKCLTLERRELDLYGKAATAAGSTSDPTWAAPLAGPKEFREAFLRIVRPLDIVGQLPGVRPVPLNTPVPVWNPTSPSSATWVGQGALKPLVAFSFASAILAPTKIQVGCAVTRELLYLGAPNTAQALRDLLVFQVVTGLNEEFIVPARAAVAGERPGSVTNAGTTVVTANNPVTDAQAVLAALQAARPTATPVLIMDPSAAAALIATDKHRDLTLAGGTAYGAQVIVAPAAGKTIAALDPSALLVADTGMEIDANRHALIALDSAPLSTAAQVLTSAWQANLVALRAERFVSWKLTTAVACQHATRA